MELKDMLVKNGAIKFGDFTLASGKKSKIFIDIKQATLHPDILDKMMDNIIEIDIKKIRMHNYDLIGCVAVGGVPIATGLSLYTAIPFIIVRKEKHETGTKTTLIGDVKDKKVLFVEDVATTGASVLLGVQTVRDNGGTCDKCIVIVDREEGAYEKCKENGIELISLFKMSDFNIKR